MFYIDSKLFLGPNYEKNSSNSITKVSKKIYFKSNILKKNW